MNTRTKNNLILVLVILALLLLSVVFIRAFYYAPNDEVPLNSDAITITPKEELAVSGHPVKLVIPKLNIDTKIQEVGITSNGNMAAPNNFSDTGWYKYGTIPGNIGSAVIAGHVNNGIALPAVFSELKTLQEGDDIYITNEDDQLLHFKVVKSDVYDFNAEPVEVFTEDYGKLIKLITCTGTWVKKYGTHDKRLVVSAILVEA